MFYVKHILLYNCNFVWCFSNQKKKLLITCIYLASPVKYWNRYVILGLLLSKYNFIVLLSISPVVHWKVCKGPPYVLESKTFMEPFKDVPWTSLKSSLNVLASRTYGEPSQILDAACQLGNHLIQVLH